MVKCLTALGLTLLLLTTPAPAEPNLVAREVEGLKQAPADFPMTSEDQPHGLLKIGGVYRKDFAEALLFSYSEYPTWALLALREDPAILEYAAHRLANQPTALEWVKWKLQRAFPLNTSGHRVADVTYVEGCDYFLALARVDWARVQPELARLKARGDINARALILCAEFDHGLRANRDALLDAAIQPALSEPLPTAILQRLFPEDNGVRYFLLRAAATQSEVGHTALASAWAKEQQEWLPPALNLLENGNRQQRQYVTLALLQLDAMPHPALLALLSSLSDPANEQSSDILAYLRDHPTPAARPALRRMQQQTESGFLKTLASDALRRFEHPEERLSPPAEVDADGERLAQIARELTAGRLDTHELWPTDQLAPALPVRWLLKLKPGDLSRAVYDLQQHYRMTHVSAEWDALDSLTQNAQQQTMLRRCAMGQPLPGDVASLVRLPRVALSWPLFRTQDSAAAALAATVSVSDEPAEEILLGHDLEAQRALLISSRAAGRELPPDAVRAVSRQSQLRTELVDYLSWTATGGCRALLQELDSHVVQGASGDALQRVWEAWLQQEFQRDPKLTEIFALRDGPWEAWVLRAHGGQVTFRREVPVDWRRLYPVTAEEQQRTRERTLDAQQWQFTRHQLASFEFLRGSNQGVHGPHWDRTVDFVHLFREGGNRVNWTRGINTDPDAYTGIVRTFANLKPETLAFTLVNDGTKSFRP